MLLICPTYNRPHALTDFVRAWGANLLRYGHEDVPMLIVDDSVGKMAELSRKAVVAAAPENLRVTYVGAEEKLAVLSYLSSALKLPQSSLARIFKSPCYGGNRNWTLLYSLGHEYLSCDDDMWPHGEFLRSRSPVADGVVCEGAFMRRADMETRGEKVDFDQISCYREFLGRKLSEFAALPQGDVLFGAEEQTAASLHAAVHGDIRLTSVPLAKRTLDGNQHIKFVHSHISGDGDIDSADIIVNFIRDGTPELLAGREEFKFVISSCIPCMTKQAWRISPAVLAVDNKQGVIPYAPTNYRFEDFVFRIYAARHPSVVTAYTRSVQHHERSLEARGTIVADFFNEETARIMKRFLMDSLVSISDTQMTFAPEIEVSIAEVEEIMGKAHRYCEQVRGQDSRNPNFTRFVCEMEAALDYFRDPRRLRQSIQRNVQAEIDDINFSNKLWPDILSAVASYTRKQELPVRVLSAGRGNA